MELHQQVRLSRGQVEEARSALQAHRSRGQVLRALMEQKESGAIPGIHGRLVSEVVPVRLMMIRTAKGVAIWRTKLAIELALYF